MQSIFSLFLALLFMHLAISANAAKHGKDLTLGTGFSVLSAVWWTPFNEFPQNLLPTGSVEASTDQSVAFPWSLSPYWPLLTHWITSVVRRDRVLFYSQVGEWMMGSGFGQVWVWILALLFITLWPWATYLISLFSFVVNKCLPPMCWGELELSDIISVKLLIDSSHNQRCSWPSFCPFFLHLYAVVASTILLPASSSSSVWLLIRNLLGIVEIIEPHLGWHRVVITVYSITLCFLKCFIKFF